MSYGWRDFGDGVRIELCDECGFDGRDADVRTRIPAALVAMDALLTDPAADQRPEPGTWSAHEYVEHCLEGCGEAIAVIRDGWPEPRVELESLTEAASALTRLMEAPECLELDRPIDVGGPVSVSPRWMLNHILHDAEHHVLDIRRGYAKLLLAQSDGPTVER